MSRAFHDTEPQPKPEHRVLVSYVVGFVLSLVFTLIPYYLVVNKTLRGSALLATILGFAALQLIVQVVFFLHLGREKKPRFNLFFLIATIVIILVVVLGSIWIMNHLHYNMSGKQVTDKVAADEAVHQINGEQIGTCPEGTGTNYRIELKNNKVTPRHTDAQLCDTLTIVNLDSVTREFTFGTYEKPGTYAGDSGKTLRSKRSLVIRLTEPGGYKFHDRILNDISGGFTVKP